jgi:hypothetical protein
MDYQRRRNLDQASPLDPNLAERVLSGALAPEDLPPALGPLAEVVVALRDDPMRAEATPADPASDGRDRATIDSMVTILSDLAHHPIRRRPWVRLPSPSPMPRPLGGVRVRLATSLVAVVLAFLVGAAYAGQLGPAQNAASVVLSKVGLSVPRHDTQDDGDESGDQGRHGPNPSGPAHDGLCNAYFHGNGGEQGGKFDSTAFQGLEDAAAQAGQTVEAFCGVQEGQPGTGPGNDKGNNGKGNDQEESDEQGENEQGSDDDDHGQDQEGSQDHGSGNQDDGSHGQTHSGDVENDG